MVLLGLLTFGTTQRGRESTAWVGHTYEVLASLEAAQGRAVDAETGVRGFAATGVPRFLDPYASAEGDARRELQRLRRLTVDNPGQQRRLDTLEARLTRVFSHLDSAVALVRARAPAQMSAPEVTALFAGGKAEMDAVRVAVAAVGAEERRLLAARTAADRRLDELMGLAVFGETLAAAVCVLVVALLLAAAERAQERHAEAEHAARVEAEDAAERLQEQAIELEALNLELHEQAEALEARGAEAERAREEAESASRVKGQLLSTVSHELRTPLNAIGGYAELLELGLRGPLTDAQREDISRIRRANQHLTGLVTDLLNFARLESGQVAFERADVALATVVDDLEALLAPQLAAKGLAFVHHACAPAPPAPPWVVRADAEKLRQLLLNLLTNAIKFTEPGGQVMLVCESDADAGVVRLVVRDTGRGIEAEHLARIFEPFVQVDRHRTPASQQGVGLGLAISRDLARGMDGDLTAESTPGQGSTFTLTLPAATPMD
ncbi:CHASE3 domain protein [Gemmatirosa kalamazoonensis]|uniref:histidine kinase n=1 Tax=Gemmatirosa kalamazoonensis TaxID=861299 RepID=W0RAX2_9BACT|nr:CHASE3 domain protein [Gemmatirosa kalamazoonensis]